MSYLSLQPDINWAGLRSRYWCNGPELAVAGIFIKTSDDRIEFVEQARSLGTDTDVNISSLAWVSNQYQDDAVCIHTHPDGAWDGPSIGDLVKNELTFRHFIVLCSVSVWSFSYIGDIKKHFDSAGEIAIRVTQQCPPTGVTMAECLAIMSAVDPGWQIRRRAHVDGVDDPRIVYPPLFWLDEMPTLDVLAVYLTPCQPTLDLDRWIDLILSNSLPTIK